MAPTDERISKTKLALTLVIGLSLGISCSYFVLTQQLYEDIAGTERPSSSSSPQNVEGAQYPQQGLVYTDTAVADRLSQQIRVLCLVMTTPRNHDAKAKYVKETWGKRCTKLLFMSSVEDKSLPSVALSVVKSKAYPWLKTKEAFRYVYEHHRDDADWFLKADDDTFVVMENLRYLLADYSSQDAHYLGCRLKRFAKQGYNSGGAGYVLSRATLDLLVNVGLNQSALCSPKDTGTEDVELGICMQNLGVEIQDTRDTDGRPRFLPLAPESHITFPGKSVWYDEFAYYPGTYGPNCCSDFAISFHFVTPMIMLEMEYYLYRLQLYGVTNYHPVHRVLQTDYPHTCSPTHYQDLFSEPLTS